MKPGEQFEEAGRRHRSSLFGELFGLLMQNKKWWMLPIISMLLLLSILLLLSSTAAGPFIYTLF